MKYFCKFILKIIGWKIIGSTDYPTKCVICVAPHTSNWDLVLGQLVYIAMGRRANFLIKKEWFFFPMNILFKILGGIPVDRSKKTSLTEQLVEEYGKRKKFQLALTPEATRRRNPDWKKGFYYIALEANVPIIVVALDYKLKVADFKLILLPTGDIDADMKKIKSCYKDVSARHPERFAY